MWECVWRMHCLSSLTESVSGQVRLLKPAIIHTHTNIRNTNTKEISRMFLKLTSQVI